VRFSRALSWRWVWVLGWCVGDLLLSRLPWPWSVVALAVWAICAMVLLFVWAIHLIGHAVVRHQHHLANRVQLAAGWLELGRIPEAQSALAAFSPASAWVVGLPAWTQVAVWWLGAQADAAGTTVVWPAERLPNDWAVARMLVRVGAALDCLTRLGGGGLLTVAREDSGYRVTVSADGPPPTPRWWWRVRFQAAHEAGRWSWQDVRDGGPGSRGG